MNWRACVLFGCHYVYLCIVICSCTHFYHLLSWFSLVVAGVRYWVWLTLRQGNLPVLVCFLYAFFMCANFCFDFAVDKLDLYYFISLLSVFCGKVRICKPLTKGDSLWVLSKAAKRLFVTVHFKKYGEFMRVIFAYVWNVKKQVICLSMSTGVC